MPWKITLVFAVDLRTASTIRRDKSYKIKDMLALLSILILVGLAGMGIFLMVSRGKAAAVRPGPPGGGESRSPAQRKSRFHAVSVCMDPSPCHAVRELAQRRILSGEAPILPLPDCDQPDCSCHFEHFSDRRDQQNRRDTLVALGRLSAIPADEIGTERRSWGERRRAPGSV